MNVLVTGCSFTAGAGWSREHGSDCKQDPRLWINIAHATIPQLQSLNLVNRAVTGASNTDIFEHTVSGLAELAHDVDTVIVQWTGMPRYSFNPGFELWDTSDSIQNGARRDHHLSNGTTWTADYIQDIVDRLRVLHHLHWEILRVVRYCRTITALAERFNSRAYFINGLCPWDQDYFVQLPDSAQPEEYTNFTKHDIIDINSHSDEDILRLYNQLHQDYAKAGGINPAQWINLYGSFRNTQVDTNFDGIHPGIQSNLNFSQTVQEFFKAS